MIEVSGVFISCETLVINSVLNLSLFILPFTAFSSPFMARTLSSDFSGCPPNLTYLLICDLALAISSIGLKGFVT